jgi:hypothetical protein
VRRAIILIAIVPLLAAGIACGGSSMNSPAAPSSTGNGAVISGSLSSGQSAASLMSVRAAGSPAGMGLTVTIAGTSMTTTIDSAGQFTFRNVPGGNLTLQFSGNGMNGQVDLSGVDNSETITLTLTVNGGSVELEDEHRRGGPQDQLEGKVQALPPTTAAGTFMVAGQLVVTDASTNLFIAGTAVQFSSLTLGQRVHVSGHLNGSSLLATTIQIQGPNTTSPDDNNGNQGNQDDSASIEGVLSSKSGAPPNLTLLVGGTIVITNGSTEVRRKGDVQTLGALTAGMTLHVEGVRQSNASILARMIQIKDDATGGAFEIEGSMGGLKGACPALTFGVNGFSIFTDASTVFTPACSTFKSGTKVSVKGVVQSNGSVKATSVTKQ